jgi:hypothetical protein
MITVSRIVSGVARAAVFLAVMFQPSSPLACAARTSSDEFLHMFVICRDLAPHRSGARDIKGEALG